MSTRCVGRWSKFNGYLSGPVDGLELTSTNWILMAMELPVRTDGPFCCQVAVTRAFLATSLPRGIP